MIENHVKKYFNPLKPDSARIVYQILPDQYADPDTTPKPIKMEVEIRDKDSVLVYGPRFLTTDEQRTRVLYWDGKDNGGQVVDMERGPFVAELTVYYGETGTRILWGCSKKTPLYPGSYHATKISAHGCITYLKNCETPVKNPIYKGHFEGNNFIVDKNEVFADLIDCRYSGTSNVKIDLGFVLKIKVDKKTAQEIPWPLEVRYELTIKDLSGKFRIDKEIKGKFMSDEEGEIVYYKKFDALTKESDFTAADFGHHYLSLKLSYWFKKGWLFHELLDEERIDLAGLKIFFDKRDTDCHPKLFYDYTENNVYYKNWFASYTDVHLQSLDWAPNWFHYWRDLPTMMNYPYRSINAEYRYMEPGFHWPIAEVRWFDLHPEFDKYCIYPQTGFNQNLRDDEKQFIRRLKNMEVFALSCRHEEFHRDSLDIWWINYQGWDSRRALEDNDEGHGDLVPDAHEYPHHHNYIYPDKRDTDGDGLNDFEEILYRHHRQWADELEGLLLFDWSCPGPQCLEQEMEEE